MKRYIYIIIGIVVAAVLAIVIILFIKSRSQASAGTPITTTGSLPVVSPQTNTTSGQAATTSNNSSTLLALGSSTNTTGAETSVGSFGVLSNNPVLDYFVDASNTITAIQPDGQIITISNGQSTIVSSSTTNNIISASFSYDGKKILVSFGTPTNPQSLIFDIKTQAWTTLPQGLLSPQWSPTNYQIAYLSSPTASGKLSLSILNAANLKAGVATLITLNANDLSLSWPNKNQFILSDKPTADNNGSIWSFNSTTGTLTPIVYEDAGAEAIWSHGSTSTLGLIFSDGSSGQNSSLQLETTSGVAQQQLNFITLPSKCLFNAEQASTTYLALYCGIPRASSGFSSAQLPDAYNMMALFTSDDVYKINTASGVTQSLWSDQAQNMDTSDLKIFNGTLFFVNRYDQKLYGLVLSL